MEERNKNIKHQQDIFIKENIRLKIKPRKNLGNKNIIIKISNKIKKIMHKRY